MLAAGACRSSGHPLTRTHVRRQEAEADAHVPHELALATRIDPDRLIREAVVDEDLVAAAMIALESYGWQLYTFIMRQAEDEVDEVFTRVADEILRGLLARGRVRDWIYTLVHGAWIRTQAGDPRAPLQDRPAFARWVMQMAAGYRSASELERRWARGTSRGGEESPVAAGEGGGVCLDGVAVRRCFTGPVRPMQRRRARAPAAARNRWSLLVAVAVSRCFTVTERWG